MHPYPQARAAADFLLKELGNYCERIEIAGSIRRGAQLVKDIEVVALGALGKEPVPGKLFGATRSFDFLERKLEQVARGRHPSISRPKQQGGRAAPWGPRYKRLNLTYDGVTYAVDLFQATEETWAPTLVIRTGSAAFARLLVTPQMQGGAMPQGLRQRDGRLERCLGRSEDGKRLVWEPLETPDEAAYFAALGLPCWPPPERTETRITDWLFSHSTARNY